MNLVSNFGTRPAQNALDRGANIVCGTRYIQKNPQDNTFIDNRFPDMAPIAPNPLAPTEDVCANGEVATGFPTSLTEPNQPSWIIVLCDGETSALADGVTINNDVFSLDWEDELPGEGTTELESTTQYISATILHEILHFVNPQREYISPFYCALYRTNGKFL